MPEKKFKISLKPIGVAILQAEKQLKSIKQKVGREHQRKLTLHIKALNRALGDVKALCRKFTSTYPSYVYISVGWWRVRKSSYAIRAFS